MGKPTHLPPLPHTSYTHAHACTEREADADEEQLKLEAARLAAEVAEGRAADAEKGE